MWVFVGAERALKSECKDLREQKRCSKVFQEEKLMITTVDCIVFGEQNKFGGMAGKLCITLCLEAGTLSSKEWGGTLVRRNLFILLAFSIWATSSCVQGFFLTQGSLLVGSGNHILV